MVKAWVQSSMPCDIRGGQSGTATGFSPLIIGFPLQIITSPLIDTHLCDIWLLTE
jgi:hypothetical protein